MEQGMPHRPVDVLSQQLSQKADAFAAANEVVRDKIFDSLDTYAVASQDYLCLGRFFTHHLGHLPCFCGVRHDEADTDKVIPLADLPPEFAQRGKIEYRRRDVYIFRHKVQAEAMVIEAVGKNPLFPRDLVMEQFHLIFLAAIHIIYREGTKHRR